MIYVSMIEIFFKAQETLVAQMGHRIGSWITVAAFFWWNAGHRNHRQTDSARRKPP